MNLLFNHPWESIRQDEQFKELAQYQSSLGLGSKGVLSSTMMDGIQLMQAPPEFYALTGEQNQISPNHLLLLLEDV